jgi:hypothetical protein
MTPGTKKICGCRNKLRFFVSRLIGERASVGPSLLIGQLITLQTFGACAGVLSRHARWQLCLFIPKPSQASGLLVTGFGQETERSWTTINNRTGHAPCFDGFYLRIDVLGLREFSRCHRSKRMSSVIKEPFAPRRYRYIVDHIEVASVSSLYQRLLRSALRVNLRVNKLADASLEDLCMLVLSLFLLFTTLLLPWVLL